MLRYLVPTFVILLALPTAVQAASGIYGTVLNGEHRPVNGASVTLVGAGLTFKKQTKSDGAFAFVALPLGSYRLLAVGQGGSGRLQVDLASGGANVTITLLPTIGTVRVVSAPFARQGGTDVVLNRQQLARTPASGSLPALLLQLPGAARGANGVVHLNGDHGDINYVIDGIAVPQALNREVGSELNPAEIGFIDVLEGAYPAQYGGRFAAVVNIGTLPGNGPATRSASVTAGSNASSDARFSAHAPLPGGSFVLNLRAQRSLRALDPPMATPFHDAGSSTNAFLRYARSLGNDLLIASLSSANQTFQIPNDVTGGQPATTDDNETQNDLFATLHFHHILRSDGEVSYSIALKRSRIRNFNDPTNDFIYGNALNLANGGSPTDCANGIVSACGFSLASDRTATDIIASIDGTHRLKKHDLSYGTNYDATDVAKRYAISLQPNNFLSPIFSPGTPGAEYTVVDNAPNVARSQTAYAQDSWILNPRWRFDYGVRFDTFCISSTGFSQRFSQISPRFKITRMYGNQANVYAYFGRFFTPFSFENVSPEAAHLLNLPLQPTVAQFDLRPERDTDVELGGHLRLGSGTLGLRLMQKIAVDVLDDTQVGVTALHQDINYSRGNISTQSAYYQQSLLGNGRLYASVTHTRAVNRGCETQLLAPCFGAPTDWTPADHDQRWDANAGISVKDSRGGWLAIDSEYGSGLSSSYCKPATDNCKVPPHTIFDVERSLRVGTHAQLSLRIGNIFNDTYRVTYLNAQGNHFAPGRTIEIGLHV